MAKYRVLEKSFINNALYEEGAIVDYDGEVAGNLEPIDKNSKTKDKAPAPAEDPLV